MQVLWKKELILRDHGSQWELVGIREEKVDLEMDCYMRQTQSSETTKVLPTKLFMQGSMGHTETEVTIGV